MAERRYKDQQTLLRGPNRRYTQKAHTVVCQQRLLFSHTQKVPKKQPQLLVD